jgi:sec-independent protein translocase protein TatA
MFGLGVTELIIILVIVVVLFGAKKLPEIGSGIGEAIKNFKKSTSELTDTNDEKNSNTTESKANKENAP